MAATPSMAEIIDAELTADARFLADALSDDLTSESLHLSRSEYAKYIAHGWLLGFAQERPPKTPLEFRAELLKRVGPKQVLALGQAAIPEMMALAGLPPVGMEPMPVGVEVLPEEAAGLRNAKREHVVVIATKVCGQVAHGE